MKQKLLYSFIMLFPCIGFAQETEFKILPFINGITSIKEGQIEIGPELNWEQKIQGSKFVLTPTIRIPLTNKSDNVLQLDRYSSTWRGVLALQYSRNNQALKGKISINSFSGQVEYGSSDFKYYPTGIKTNEQKQREASYAYELKYIGFFTKGKPQAKQFSPQFRLRFSNDWKPANEVGVVNPVNINGVITTSNLIIEAPNVKPTFSPAFSFQIYSGKGSCSYSPTIYYDATGKKWANNQFDNLARLRLESWVFFYPLISGSPNVKIGVSPFLSIRTSGTDDFKKAEYGGVITIKFGTSFLQFF